MGKEPPERGEGRLSAILEAVRRDRNRPLTLRCHADSAYRFQNPGLSENTPEGELFNEKRDLDVPVKLVRGCCMICEPCRKYDPESGLCRGGLGMNLRDQKKDLEVLQRLGLEYGDVLPARDLYALLCARIHSTTVVCGWGDRVVRAPEWSICSDGPEGNPSYVKSRETNMGFA